MVSNTTVTFRSQTYTGISDLLCDEGLNCAQSQNLLTFLVGALPGYTDEGVRLSPAVLLCESIARIAQGIPGAVMHNIGVGHLSPDIGPRILKDCAPLSGTHWSIFIERRSATELAYGVFSYPALPTTMSLSEAIAIPDAGFATLVRATSPNTVELIGAKGGKLTVVFSTVREAPVLASDPVGSFAGACAIGVSGDTDREAFQRYFRRLLDRALTTSHGTILVCSDRPITIEGALSDSVAIAPELDFLTAFSNYQRTGTAEDIVRLQNSEELLEGLMRCDGIVQFNTRGCVIAYRGFYRSGTVEQVSGTVVGGARRRAYEGLKELIGTQLIAVLFRSQDGLTLHYGN